MDQKTVGIQTQACVELAVSERRADSKQDTLLQSMIVVLFVGSRFQSLFPFSGWR